MNPFVCKGIEDEIVTAEHCGCVWAVNRHNTEMGRKIRDCSVLQGPEIRMTITGLRLYHSVILSTYRNYYGPDAGDWSPTFWN